MVSNSNNWQTEAELRNKRKAKADSMSALLDHVEWNPETLEIKFKDITLDWGSIEGADETVTRITKNTITTEYVNALKITADSLSAKAVSALQLDANQINAGSFTMTGGSINVDAGGTTTNKIKLYNGSCESTMSPSTFKVKGSSITTEIMKDGFMVSSNSGYPNTQILPNGLTSYDSSGNIVAQISSGGAAKVNTLQVSGISAGSTKSYQIVVCGSSGILYKSSYTIGDMQDWSK